MKHNYVSEYKNVRIRPLYETDLEQLREWRNDETISQYLRKIPFITSEMQRRWWLDDCNDANILSFAIEETELLNNLVGSLSIYNINGNNAEVGKIVVGHPDAKGRKIGYYSFLMAIHIGFSKMGIEEFVLNVHENNKPAYTNYIKIGFTITGSHEYSDGGVEYEMILTKEHFEECHDFLVDIKLTDHAAN